MSELPCITDSGDERGGTECANAGDADEALTELAAARNQVDLMGELADRVVQFPPPADENLQQAQHHARVPDSRDPES